MHKQLEGLEAIIVLACTTSSANGNFPNVVKHEYIGAQVRMDALAALAGITPEKHFFLVGGADKVTDMATFMAERTPARHITGIHSLPCTFHNFISIYEYLATQDTPPRRIGILSNEYHLQRALLMAEVARHNNTFTGSATLIPLSAEQILAIEATDLLHDYSSAYIRRIIHEAHGAAQLLNHTYKDSCTNSYIRNYPQTVGIT